MVESKENPKLSAQISTNERISHKITRSIYSNQLPIMVIDRA